LLLIRFEVELWNVVDARLKSEFGLPLTHFEPMAVMDRLPACRVYDIANELGITTGGTSKLVDRIEANGYCRRLPNPADRRSSLLELTPGPAPVRRGRGGLRRRVAAPPRHRGAGADPTAVRGDTDPPAGGRPSARGGADRLMGTGWTQR